MAEYGYNLIITSDNNFAKVNRTIDSIMNQERTDDFDICVVVVDFDSSDGTYDKLLDMAESYPIAVYQLKDRRTGRTRIADASAFLGYQNAPSQKPRYMSLRAGDVLYKNAFIRTTELFKKYDHHFPALLVTEVDVEDADGKRYNYPAIQDQEGIIDFESSADIALSRGFRNNVLCVGGGFSGSYQMADSLANERIWWNKLYYRLSNSKIIYSPCRLGIIQEINYEDEIDDILLRWNVLIGHVRIKTIQNRNCLLESEIDGAKQQLAMYSLWRGCKLLEKQANEKAEDCLLLSRMIDKTIINSDEYKLLNEIIKMDSDRICELQGLFACGKRFVD